MTQLISPIAGWGAATAVTPFGTQAVRVRFDGADLPVVQTALLENPLPGQLEVIAGADTIVVTATSAAALPGLVDALAHIHPGSDDSGPHQRTPVPIDTVYDGEDLPELAAVLDMSVEALIAAHTTQQWEAAFLGFAPGFAYLRNVSIRPVLAGIPRRDTPRTVVPAGSVALADDYSTVYPHPSPGGWQLIGRTDTVVWDLSRPEPALITTGTPVRFRACRPTATVRTTPVPDSDTARSATAGQTPVRPGLQVVAPGMQSLYQDRGRTGFAHLGVSGSGAADRASAARANRLVGNPATATVIEAAIGGLHLVAESDEVLVVTGAEVPLAIRSPRGDWEPGNDTPFALREGDHLILGTAVRGRLAYVAARGGFRVDAQLGSSSTDTLSGLGPPPLGPGHHCEVDPAPVGAVVGDPEHPPAMPGPETTTLRVVPGPDADWFDAEQLDRFYDTVWTVTPASNRVGSRLSGTPLKRARQGELASQGAIVGAIQVPPSGLPVLFHADHPVTGGYPVIAAVADVDLDRAAQIPFGGRIRFTPTPSRRGIR